MKKRLAIFIALLLVCGLVGCAQTEPQTGQESQNVQPVSEGNASDDPSQESQIPSDASHEEVGIGGPGILCAVHDFGFHDFAKSFIDLVGQEAFMDWAEQTNKAEPENGCDLPEQSIYTMIHDFGISRDDFEQAYYSGGYSHPYDLDILFGDDYSAVDAYFRDTERLQTIRDKRRALWDLKVFILLDHETELTELYPDRTQVQKWSLIELVQAFDISRQDLERYMDQANQTVNNVHYTYNMDLIYQPEESPQIAKILAYRQAGEQTMQSQPPDPYPVRALDAAVCGIDDYETE